MTVARIVLLALVAWCAAHQSAPVAPARAPLPEASLLSDDGGQSRVAVSAPAAPLPFAALAAESAPLPSPRLVATAAPTAPRVTPLKKLLAFASSGTSPPRAPA